MNYIQPKLLYFTKCDSSNSSLGHMMYNYITGLLFSKEMDLEFIHSDLTGYAERFNEILNLKNKFRSEDDIMPSRILTLSSFDFRSENGIERCINQIERCNHPNILFKLDFKNGNLFPGRLIKNSEWLIDLFSNSYFDKNKKIKVYNNLYKNIAVHIRRGDITEHEFPGRWQPVSYYINIINKLNNGDSSRFFILSDGCIDDFKELQDAYADLNIVTLSSSPDTDETIENEKFDSKFNLVLGGKDTEILHMLAQSDVLVTGQSSFSTFCSYINRGEIIYTKCNEFTDFEDFKDKRFISASTL